MTNESPFDFSDDDPEFDAVEVSLAIDAVEAHYDALLMQACVTLGGDTVAIAHRSPDALEGKFYGPKTKIVLEAARLWHDYLRTEDEEAEGRLQKIRAGAADLITPPAPAIKTVYRVLVSLKGEIMDDDYFLPYDRRKDAFIFAAGLDPETYDFVDVVEGEVPAGAGAAAPQIENDTDDVDF
jgi:hypothetical protein